MKKSRKKVEPRKLERDSRRIACQTLYGLSFMDGGGGLEQAFALASRGDKCAPATREMAWNFASGACEKLEELDGTINSLVRNWKDERLGKMERAFLRLALYEMLYQHTPPKIVISETLDMADQFGNGGSKSFLNGVLHAASKSAQAQK